ncbi:MAG: mono/diheme cytochrome c family protein [Paraglaciecola sp.]|jgi:mono/diheme cytochrome c family protein
MKVLNFILGTTIITLSHCALAQETGNVEIIKTPLTWKEARLTDGGELFVELCAACHGKGGKADGPVAAVLKTTVPDLTLLAAKNKGVFPEEQIEDSIIGKSKVISHGTIDMPVWGAAFEGVRPDWKPFRREAWARQRIHNLVEYISTIQQQ